MTNEKIKQYVSRIERLAEERQALNDDIKNVYNEAKGDGFDVKALREVVRRRKLDRQKREELDDLVTVYEGAVE